MSWRNVISLFFVAVMFFGCSAKRELVKFSTIDVPVDDSVNFLLFEALYNQYNDKNISKSVQNYMKLYEKTKSDIYLKSAIKLSFVLDKNEQVDKMVEEGIKKFPNDRDMMKIYAQKYMQEKKYKKAQKLLRKVLKHEKNSQIYNLYGNTFYFQKKYKTALKYFKKAYKIDLDEIALVKIATLLDEKLKKKKKAIEYLQSHIKFNNNVSLSVYLKLLQLYGKNTNVDGLISTYESMYYEFEDDKYARKVVELYMYQNKIKKAIRFLENSSQNSDLLMDLYVQDSRFDKAYELAKRLYERKKDIKYLGRMAIYEYEANQEKLSPKVLKSVSKKFEEVVEKMQVPLFLNYYGYLLIDHDLNVEKGIRYVKMALEREPDSVYYVDSLAWGYYKQKKCKKALELMDGIINKTDEIEVKKHYDIIKQCAKGKS